MQPGKTIAARRNKPESDSERERVRRSLKKQKILKLLAVVILFGVLVFLSFKAFQGWYDWISRKEEVIEIPKEPTVEVIDDATGRRAETISSRMKEYIANLEEEFTLVGRKIMRVRIPADKARELDVEVEGFSGFIKVSIDRNAAVSAEDSDRMLKYLEAQGITDAQYIDVRIERKGYWK